MESRPLSTNRLAVALRADLARQLRALPFEPEVLLLSFHGMPERTRAKGDPYYGQCLETARLLVVAD